MSFAIATAALAAIVALVLGLSLRGGRVSGAEDVAVYREQLLAVDRDLAAGLIAPDEAGRLRLEVSRRLLDADRSARSTPAGGGRGPAAPATAAIALIVLGGGLALYQRLGSPGYADLPRAERLALAARSMAERPAQDVAEARLPPFTPPADADPESLALIDKLRAAVSLRVGDLKGQSLLARYEAAIGNWRGAAAAQRLILGIKAGDAVSADWAAMAEYDILAAGGYVSPEAEAALRQTLKLDPNEGSAIFYMGLLYAQNDRPDQAFALWKRLLDSSAPDAPWLPTIRAEIEALAAAAGIDYALPTEKGPTAADIAAAGQMSAEDRTAMIQSMVAQLADRLATQGGPASDWARLITAYGVLGRGDDARKILDEARQVFKDSPADLAAIDAAAQGAGVGQ
jgi:cytochrome c-type biogenesis protein CcmH